MVRLRYMMTMRVRTLIFYFFLRTNISQELLALETTILFIANDDIISFKLPDVVTVWCRFISWWTANIGPADITEIHDSDQQLKHYRGNASSFFIPHDLFLCHWKTAFFMLIVICIPLFNISFYHSFTWTVPLAHTLMNNFNKFRNDVQ